MPDISSDVLHRARLTRTPDLVARLREAAQAYADLADHLDAEPGDGIGLSYGRIWDATDRAQSAMMRYQNNPTGVE